MALKDIFKMTKANRYTADGREELIKAQEAVTEDRRYNIGEISEKTGLQKTANGWVKPTKGKVAGKRAVEAKGKEVQRQMKHDDLVSRMAEEERIWNKNHPDKAHYNYNPKPESKPAAERNHGTEQKKRGPGAIHTPGKGNVGMDKMKEAAEKGLKGQELKEFMTGSKSESKPAESTSSAPKTESTPEQKNMLDYFKTVKEKVNSEGKGSVPLRDFKKASEIQMAINKYNDWKAGRLTRRGGPDGILEGEELGKALKNDIERLGLNPSDVIGDSAPRILTGDTRIRVRK